MCCVLCDFFSLYKIQVVIINIALKKEASKEVLSFKGKTSFKM